MRLLIDENVSPIVGQALRAAGHDVIAAADLCPGAPDDEVVALATTEGRILVSEDKDFGNLAFQNEGCAHPGSFWSACLAICRRRRPRYWWRR